MFKKQIKVFDKIYNERFSRIDEIVKELDFNNLNNTYMSGYKNWF